MGRAWQGHPCRISSQSHFKGHWVLKACWAFWSRSLHTLKCPELMVEDDSARKGQLWLSKSQACYNWSPVFLWADLAFAFQIYQMCTLWIHNDLHEWRNITWGVGWNNMDILQQQIITSYLLTDDYKIFTCEFINIFCSTSILIKSTD